MQSIRTQKSINPKQKPDYNHLGFGNFFTDHMFLMNYSVEKGWYDPRIVPYAPIALDPSAMVFHYGQEIFEGLKAYKAKDGRILLFRPDRNMARLNLSNDRLCIPLVDEEFGIEAIKALVKQDADWIPTLPGTSLYIRPFIIATDEYLGVRASHSYLFIIILSPVGNYYPEGVAPVKIYVEEKYVRAVRGGLGFAKAGANYAASIKSQEEAKHLQYTQVLWLDGVERKYIEEVGTMNVFFKINGEIVTPELQGSILPGITRMSCIELLKSWGYKVVEKRLSIEELVEASDKGLLEEAFGTGTAAVISPIGELNYASKIMEISGGSIGPVSQKLYDTLVGIQYGDLPDEKGWITEIK